MLRAEIFTLRTPVIPKNRGHVFNFCQQNLYLQRKFRQNT